MNCFRMKDKTDLRSYRCRYKNIDKLIDKVIVIKQQKNWLFYLCRVLVLQSDPLVSSYHSTQVLC